MSNQGMGSDRDQMHRTEFRAVSNLHDAQAARQRAEAQIDDAVRTLRGCGWSWSEVAEEVGVSRQAARQRWGRDELV